MRWLRRWAGALFWGGVWAGRCRPGEAVKTGLGIGVLNWREMPDRQQALGCGGRPAVGRREMFPEAGVGRASGEVRAERPFLDC